MVLEAILLAAVTWYPAADWTEKPDPEASPYARRGGTIRMNGAQPPKSFNAYVDNNSYSAMLMDLMYMKLLGMSAQTSELEPSLARKWAVSDDGREFAEVQELEKTRSGVEAVIIGYTEVFVSL